MEMYEDSLVEKTRRTSISNNDSFMKRRQNEGYMECVVELDHMSDMESEDPKETTDPNRLLYQQFNNCRIENSWRATQLTDREQSLLKQLDQCQERVQNSCKDIRMTPFRFNIPEGSPTKPHTTSERRDNIDSDTDDSLMDQETPDPLYDDQLDDENDAWVSKTIRDTKNGKTASDAVLSCPCCFISVCWESQRHIKYVTQYRATYALNCIIEKNEAYSKAPSTINAPDDALYYPVRCQSCSTELGVFDSSENYHFFNVLPSHA